MFVLKEHYSSVPYLGNKHTNISHQEVLDSLTPKQKVYADGGKYFGTFQNGLRHGFGKYYFINDDTYEGMWCRNQRHGEGIYLYQNGEVYRGSYEYGQRHGHG